MAYKPVISGGPGIEDGTIVLADLAFSLQSLIGGGTPIGGAMDFEGFTLPPLWLWEDGAAVDRTTYSDLLDAITITQTGTLNATINITGLTSTKSIRVGCPVEGTNIPSGATVASIVSTTAVTISMPATGSGNTPITFLPHGGGDGSTTFNTPDARGRTSVGMDDLGGNGVAGVLDAAQVGIGRELGQQNVALTPAQAPLRSHSHSGTTGSDNIDHGHSGSTGTVSADHGHSGTTGDINQNHQHYPSGFNGFVNAGLASGRLAGSSHWMGQATSSLTSTVTGGHTHNFGTGGINTNHVHGFSTGGRSAFHQHAFTTGTPSVAEANGAAHENMQPSRLVNRIIYAGA